MNKKDYMRNRGVFAYSLFAGKENDYEKRTY